MKPNEKILSLINALIRVGSVVVVLLLEIGLILVGVVMLHRSAMGVYLLLQVFSVPLIYFMVNKEPRYKLNWVLIIFLLPGAVFTLFPMGQQA